MAQIITATIGSIDQLRQMMQEQLQLIKQKEDELEQRIANLAGMWEGEAHEAFHEDMTNGLNALRDNTESAWKLTKFEELAVNEYSMADQDAEDTVNAM